MRDGESPDLNERAALLLFERLSELEPESPERRGLLDAASAEVRTIVDALEQADRRATGRFATDFIADAAIATEHPERVGPYRLVAPIAAGGMGEVWRAERDDGLFEQVVAIKLIRAGIMSSLAADRFNEERRLLARIEHPNVARLIDGGVADGGRPWLATEYVAGETIDRAAATLPLASRVRLFLQAAQAVQFAHGRLIAHGDIKPANVLVDDQARARLLDFGVGRMIEGNDPQTKGALTPGFASPERLAGAPPSVSDDIFALGRTLDALTGDTRDRELAAIVACATAPEAKRYRTAQALIDDAQRWLDRRPVAAMHGGALYHVRKFVERNRAGTIVTTLALIGLIAATVMAERNYRREQQARAIEALRFADAHRAANYMMFTLLDQLERHPGTLRLRAQIGAIAQRYLDRLAASPNAPREVRLDVARGYLRAAATTGMGNAPNLADAGQAGRALDRAVRMLEALRREDPHWPKLVAPLSRAASLVCQNQLYGNHHDADAALRAARTGLAELAGIAPDTAAAAWPVRICAGDALVWLNRTDRAIPLLEGELRAARARRPADPHMLERNLRILGEAYFYAQRHEDAVRVLEEAAAIQRAAHAAAPFYGPAVIEAANVADDLAASFSALHRPQDQLRVSREALALVEAQARLDPDDRQSERRALSMMRLVADALAQLGRPREGAAMMEEVDRRWAAIRQRFPGDAHVARMTLMALQITGDLQRKARRGADACASYRAADTGWAAFARRWRLSPSDQKEAVAQIRRNVAACAGRGSFVDG